MKIFFVKFCYFSATILCSHIGRGAIFNPCLKSYDSSEERIISFERTKTNHDKQQSRDNNASTYIAHNLHKLSSCVQFFENNLREFGILDAVCEEIIKVHILLNQGRNIFKKELIYKRRCGSLFCYL